MSQVVTGDKGQHPLDPTAVFEPPDSRREMRTFSMLSEWGGGTAGLQRAEAEAEAEAGFDSWPFAAESGLLVPLLRATRVTVSWTWEPQSTEAAMD